MNRLGADGAKHVGDDAVHQLEVGREGGDAPRGVEREFLLIALCLDDLSRSAVNQAERRAQIVHGAFDPRSGLLCES